MFRDGAARASSYSSLGENVMGVSATGNPINPTDDAFSYVTDTCQDRFTSLPKALRSFAAAHHVEKPTEHNTESPIVQSVDLNPTPTSYVGAADTGNQHTSTKGESSKFNFIKVDNVFEGVELSMPHGVV
ncbi:hypothetical protein Tco_0208564 [Tanacetum coccineum]